MSDQKEYAPDEEPDTEDLEEPSVAKEPGEEPKAPEQSEPEPSHHAVGIGIVESGDIVPPEEDGGSEAGADPGEDPDEDPYEG
ncbi:hypothetical protein [Microbacterium sp.]|uniref:hypothetical protein n=1 Tax=Microbacterium sp. TaxID=51671 RepID=UPI0037364EE7